MAYRARSRQVELPLSLLSSDYGSSTIRSRLYRLTCLCATARVAQRGGTRAEHQRNCAATRSFADVLSGCGGATSAEDCFGSECVLAGSRSGYLKPSEAEVQRLGRSNTQQPFDLAQARCAHPVAAEHPGTCAATDNASHYL